jgi:hypothetical protein
MRDKFRKLQKQKSKIFSIYIKNGIRFKVIDKISNEL